MLLNPAMSAALDRIADRAADVRRAFTPGALPRNDDVAAASERYEFTLDPLSVAAPDGAYFVTRDQRGRTTYGRDGRFSVAQGRLVDSRGFAVMGRTSPGAPMSELRIDAVDAELGRTRSLRVEPDGSLVYTRDAIDPRNGKRVASNVVAGRIVLARFPAASRLDSSDGRSFSAPE